MVRQILCMYPFLSLFRSASRVFIANWHVTLRFLILCRIHICRASRMLVQLPFDYLGLGLVGWIWEGAWDGVETWSWAFLLFFPPTVLVLWGSCFPYLMRTWIKDDQFILKHKLIIPDPSSHILSLLMRRRVLGFEFIFS